MALANELLDLAQDIAKLHAANPRQAVFAGLSLQPITRSFICSYPRQPSTGLALNYGQLWGDFSITDP